MNGNGLRLNLYRILEGLYTAKLPW